MVMVVPSTITVLLSLDTTVVPLKVNVVVVLSESVLLDSVIVASVAASEALLVKTEFVSDAVVSMVLELVLELMFSSVLFVSDADISLVVLSAVSEELASEVEDVFESSDVSLLIDVAVVSAVVVVVLVSVAVLVSVVFDVSSVCTLDSIRPAVVSPVVTVEIVDSVFTSSAETLLLFKTTELAKIKLATRTDPAVFHFDDFLIE